ncbi:MAG TPA: NAD(+) diphosphatase [Azospirillaceae bacterium]|nr:NAD(+) diphosphatase [Azospirillaceae bacterium]
MDKRINLYAGSGLDRASAFRRDDGWMAARLAEPETRLLPVWRLQPFLTGDPTAPRLGFLTGDAAAELLALPGERAFLGLDPNGGALFVLDVSALETPEQHPALSAGGRFAELRSAAAWLPSEEAGMAAYARGLLWWHQRHRFCGVCGSPTGPEEAGHVRRCADPACATPHFPRTDPAVIMLVHDGDRVLLARTPRFPPGNYSVLAGFVEPGETLEEAVAREVLEETGIRAADVRYHSSQPWPFPASLMIGFVARAASTDIAIDPNEMEDAGWFHRDRVRRAETGQDTFNLPSRDSVARRMIDDWVKGYFDKFE